MTQMKALITTEPKTVTVQEIDIPTPEEGQILVKTTYVAQNPTDWKSVASAPPGRISGCDFAGIIENPNGSKWQKGQRVAGWVHGARTDPIRGAFAEYLVTEASLVYAVPDNINDAQAAAVSLAFATAVQAMYQRLNLPEPSKPAETAKPFLVYGGTTSVGKYAIQLAKLSGLFVVATGSKRNHELLKALGADVTVDYNDADWPEQARKAANDGLEYALDGISEKGSIQAVAKAMSSTKGGHLITLLPVGKLRDSGEIENKKVKLESTIAYSVFGRTLRGTSYYPSYDNCGEDTPEDKAVWEKYLGLLPDLLSSGKVKPNRTREMGGLADILTGFEEQKAGKVSAEKLVYKI